MAKAVAEKKKTTKVTPKPAASRARASGTRNTAAAPLKAIWNGLPALELDAGMNIRSVSAPLCVLLGYDAAELVGQPYSRLLPYEWAHGEEYRRIWGQLSRGEGWSGLQPRLAKGGGEVWLNVSGVAIAGAAGRPARFLELCSDASKSHAEVEELRCELKVRKDIMDLTSLVSVGDKRGDILFANAKYSEVSGYSNAELVGSPHSINRHPDVPKAVFKEMWQTIGRGEVFRGVVKNQRKSGAPYYVDAVIAPILGRNGKPQKYLGVRYDITEREIARIDMEGMIAAIDRSQAMIEFELDGRIIKANENFCKVMGYSQSELEGQQHSLFVETEYRASDEYRRFWDKLARGEPHVGQFKRIARDGREVWLQAAYSPVLDGFGKPIKVIKFATDVTERVNTANDMARVLGALAAGDLTQRITAEYTGHFQSMKDDANRTVEALSEIVQQILQTTDAINTASAEIATGNTDLSHRTEEQASNLEETASSMEQLTATVKQNADNAQQANQLAATASEMAAKGGHVVSEVVETMSAIRDSSKKIVDIISVIDGIAFQTNILALNAAVEAARAGEQGRGFAVVASEVRNLAQRSAAAAKEIKTLIGDSVDKVGTGSTLVEGAGRTMEEIVAAVKRVTDIMGEISAASREQSDGIEQVNQAIAQMDQATQQNAALVEQSAAAAESMSEQARGLTELVGRFRLTGDTAAPQVWDGTERRGPDRATNVLRIPATRSTAAHGRAASGTTLAPSSGKPAGATGTHEADGWESF